MYHVMYLIRIAVEKKTLLVDLRPPSVQKALVRMPFASISA